MSRRMATAFADGSDSSSDGSDSADDFDREEFNPRKRRRIAKDAKMDAALGVFGSESEDESYVRNRNRNARSKGMAFVSAGQKTMEEEEDEDEDEDIMHRTGLGGTQNTLSAEQPKLMDDQQEAEEEDDYEDEKPRFGFAGVEDEKPRFGFAGVADQRTQFRPGQQATATPGILQNRNGAMASPFGLGFVPSSAAVPILRDDLADEKPSTPRASLPSAFSTPTAAPGGRGGNVKKPAANGKVPFAVRMMQQMGYQEGKGLGKDLSGRANVIEVQLRPTGVGVGAVREKSAQEKSEERRQAALRGEVLVDSDEERKKRKSIRPKNIASGTSSAASTPKRKPKAKYQSIQDVQRAAPGLKIPDAFSNILDMTGPGQRLLTSSSGLLTPVTKSGVEESAELIEARKLARRAQADLNAFVEEWKNLEERKAWIAEELKQQHQLIDAQSKITGGMESVTAHLTKLSVAVNDNEWNPVIEVLTEIDTFGPTNIEEISDIAASSIYPFLRQAVAGWEPLPNPRLVCDSAPAGLGPALSSIKHLLGVNTSRNNENGLVMRDVDQAASQSRGRKTTAFESLMFREWFPKVRTAITNSWDVYDPSPLQELLETWEEILPDFIRHEILDKLVVSKLNAAIDNWNPKKSRKSRSQQPPLPHLWLFPWLQYLPTHHADPNSKTGLVGEVKRKFRDLADSWDYNQKVIPGIEKWKQVLQPRDGHDQWKPLLINHIVPHLSKYFESEFRVDPQDQEPWLQYLEKTLKWASILGTRTMSNLLADKLFPMWLDVLHAWLTMDGVDHEDVIGWIKWWRTVLPSDLNDATAVRTQWIEGLDLMELALELGEAAEAELPLPQVTTQQPIEPTMPAPAPAPPVAPTERTIQRVVKDFSSQNGWQFLPQRNIMDAHGPLYRITPSFTDKGGVLIYFAGDKVFAKSEVFATINKEWVDIGEEETALLILEALLEDS